MSRDKHIKKSNTGILGGGVLFTCLVLGTARPIALGQSGGAARSDAPRVSTAIEDEVLENLRGQELGPAAVRDLKLPEPFLRRVADRVIRTTFRERYRVVVAQTNLPVPVVRSDAIRGSSAGNPVGPGVLPVTERAMDDRATAANWLAWGAGGFVIGLAVLYVVLWRRGRRA
ncbi:MAG: hypothetical protein HBSAPP02_21310 [Phycisphaerae bacterium]|nr:MAG: hypothetical protein HRU71_05605 [Planctomycetia bacterium]RIK67961.1 MAG: hypothetical protein DCC66_10945 [Planctomycetota bacterium]GJQ27099.1 MAG: hypothetical protein HBSAPP02_21310 [Phycisphaerae bacterium]